MGPVVLPDKPAADAPGTSHAGERRVHEGTETRGPAAARRRPRLPAAAGLVALTGVALLLRLEGIHDWFWLDEAISVGISSHPLGQIPGLLVQDGSPPLYYLLLRGWMLVFGRSELQTHALSLAFAVATVPLSYWAGSSLFGGRVGWVLAVMAATNPYLTLFSRETRMYTLVVFLALLATTTFLHAFAFGRRRFLVPFVLSLSLLLYTHNWGIWFAAGCVLAVVPCLLARPDRARVAREAVLAFVAVGLLYLPWVPTLLAQARHTAAPWSPRPVLREAVSALGGVLGDERVLVALLLTLPAGLAGLVRRPRTPAAAALFACLLVLGTTLGGGWLAAQVLPAWSPRYWATFLPPLLVVAALGLARAGRRGLGALVLILLFWTQPLGRLTGVRAVIEPGEKSNEKALSRVVSPHLRPGDLVVAVQMEEVPLLHYYLPPGLRYADVTGPVADPQIVDWRDATERVAASNERANLTPLMDRLAPGQQVLLVCPRITVRPRDPQWFKLMDERCGRWRSALLSDSRLERVPLPGLEAVQVEAVDKVLLFRALPR